jgi:glutaconate CoA-transferase subunit B
MSSEAKYTTADLLVVAMAREIRDGELLAQGIGTHLPTCAYFVAKRTHAPSCRLLYSIGGTISDRVGPISLTGFERLALTSPLRRVGYSELVCDTLAGLPFKEFSRPAQVDGYGNTNNTVIGHYAAPKLKLPGAGGIPDFSPYASHHSLLYVPRHDRRTLVERLDFRSGVGGLNGESAAQRAELGVTGRGARRLVTDLGVFAFSSNGAVLEALHPGSDVGSVIAATGFAFEHAADMAVTDPPTEAQVALIDELDPDRIRELEFLPSGERFNRIRALAGSRA